MKKTTKRLLLSRETVHTLGAVAGGDVLPALNTLDFVPRTTLCHTNFCTSNCVQTLNCPLITLGCPITTF
jgi:hypothetical protein